MIADLRVFGLAAAAVTGVMLVAGWPALAADEITIGAPLPLTGALSPEGEKLKMGYELWLEELEKRGGISVGGVKHKVKLVYSDYQSQTPRAVQLAEKLISSDKVNFLFSPFGSGAIKAASSVAEKYGVPMMASTASSKEVYDQNYKNLFGLYTPMTRSASRSRRWSRPSSPTLHASPSSPVTTSIHWRSAASSRSRRSPVACRWFISRNTPLVRSTMPLPSRRSGPPSPTGSWRPATSTISS